MLRTILIDDEAHIRDTLRKLVEIHAPQVSIVGEAPGVTEGIRAIRKLNPDLVFLDINMKDGTGFDLLDALESVNFKIIFISASDKNISGIMKSQSSEFLTKPFNPDDFIAAVDQVERDKSWG